MRKCKMIKGNIDSIESFGLVDGPGIRTVVFLSGCHLRCKYCHNPEMWQIKEGRITPLELVNKIKRFKPYYQDTGGVTFSGGEPLLQKKFLIEVSKLLKKENIHIALDTAGVGDGDYDELLSLIDLVLLDIKHTDSDSYRLLTGKSIDFVECFIDALNRSGRKVWIRQVIIPDVTDSIDYIQSLAKYLKKIKNIERIDFLPYHTLGKEKYSSLGIPYFYEDKKDMDVDFCNELYEKFLEIRKSSV